MCFLKTMKKSTPTTSPNSTRSEIQKLYRHIQQLSQRLDIQLKQAVDWKEWFDNETLQSRQRIRDVCEHILLSGQCELARKTEEYLWRKAFYDVIHKLKADKKALKTQAQDALLACVFTTHLQGAFGFYQHLLVRLKLRFNIKLHVDWIADSLLPSAAGASDNVTTEQKNWASKACQRCLIYLGDIARYQCDASETNDYHPERYYHLAILLLPENGMPHNQIGTLKQAQGQLQESCYHYMRCILSSTSFDGAEENLKRVLEKHRQIFTAEQEEAAENNTTISSKVQFESLFLTLQEVLFGIRSISMGELAEWCQSLLTVFAVCLSEGLPPQPAINGAVKHDEITSPHDGITSPALVKYVTMLVLDVVRLRQLGSELTSAAMAFGAALLSQLLEYVSQYLKQNFPVPQQDNEDGFERARRQIVMSQRKRRRRRISSQSEEQSLSDSSSFDDFSDLSEGELDETLAEDLSDEEETLSNKEDEVEVVKCEPKVNGIIRIKTRKSLASLSRAADKLNEQLRTNNPKMSVKLNGASRDTGSEGLVDEATKLTDDFERMNREAYFPALKVMFDWVKANPAVLLMSAKASPVLWQRLAEVLNCLPSKKVIQTIVFYFASHRRIPTWMKQAIDLEAGDEKQKHALPEDIAVLGSPGFGEFHDDLDTTWCSGLSHSQLYQFVLRVTYLKRFGRFIAANEDVPCFTYDSEKGKFIVEESTTPPSPGVNNKKKGFNQRNQMMKALAKEKLMHEVTELERRLEGGGGEGAYLVVDTPVLCKHVSFLRQIVKSGEFIVIVPIQVIAALDDLKKFNQTARDGIKFLEEEIKHGNRWLKTQKDHEVVENHLGKGRKKNREIDEWRFLQIVRCCLYFRQEQGGAVTLLTTETSLRGGGAKMGTRPYPQALATAQEKGVRVEPIIDFYKRWTSKIAPA